MVYAILISFLLFFFLFVSYVHCNYYERSAKRGASLLLYTGEKSV